MYAEKCNENSAGSASMYNSNRTATECAARDPSSADVLSARLSQLRDTLSINTKRMIDFGARAYGGSPVGSDKKQDASRPQVSGTLGGIDAIVCDLIEIASLQQDAITYAERIV